MDFENIKHNYEIGLWNKTMVKIAVRKGVITREDYTKITGEEYK